MSELLAYLENPTDPLCNMNLARWYENQGHLSPACGFYLRAAEFSESDDLSYECMIRLYYCFSSLGNRDYTCENALKASLHIKPRSPEAYFLLSQFYERKGNWMDSYLYASLGLDMPDRTPSQLKFGSSYEGEHVLLFQKAVAAWWYGKPRESRVLLRRLMEDYRSAMNETYLKLVQDNLSRLGSGSETESCVRYDNSKYDAFKFKFKGLEEIKKNYSQVCQDLFVLSMLDGKRNGSYLEIGAAHSHHNSNTALLEELGWTGVGVELNNELAAQHSCRKNKVLCADALSLDYALLLSENFSGNTIDYLQLDIEPPRNTFDAMLAIPFEKYKFRVITYEHDHYVDITKSYREKSRRYLSSLGYKLVVNDVAPLENCNFEDWWVMPGLVDENAVNAFMDARREINVIRKLMFS